jgi:hypothetical protein
MEYMEYAIIDATSKEELQKKVEDYFSQGWICQGGIAVYDGNLVQAVVRERKIVLRPNR